MERTCPNSTSQRARGELRFKRLRFWPVVFLTQISERSLTVMDATSVPCRSAQPGHKRWREGPSPTRVIVYFPGVLTHIRHNLIQNVTKGGGSGVCFGTLQGSAFPASSVRPWTEAPNTRPQCCWWLGICSPLSPHLGLRLLFSQ